MIGVRPPVGSVEARLIAAQAALAAVEDPEMPGLCLVDLGIVRHVRARPDGVLSVGLSPTYTGCPATEVIRASVELALTRAGVAPFSIGQELSPPWSSDWITSEGRRKLSALDIVPPPPGAAARRLFDAPASACPRCKSTDTECISEFGSTPCKALHRCRSCLEPFETFKCI